MADADLMLRAIELAMQGRGEVEPNPMVGCVLAKNGRVIAEGYHQHFGGPHAEANALAACDNPAGATAYVSLEPCCPHAYKKTPACAPALIAAKVSRVFAACLDPSPLVAGNGLRELQAAGIDVHEGLLGDKAKQLNAAYFKTRTQRRPYVILKWAQTANGIIGSVTGERLIISNETSQEVTHRLRSRCDGILVGVGTALADDPLLTARVPKARAEPLRILLDSRLRLGFDSQLVKTATQTPTLLCCSQATFKEKPDDFPPQCARDRSAGDSARLAWRALAGISFR
jgi:diaminohydroxyphosphoribosylaminopyrimidine deaminase/5-amino-6-(5-phosphoribosylamino)uracil reductase